MSLESGWFTEKCLEQGAAFSLKVKQKLYEEKTPYQLIEIYETETFGRLMTLDGLVMLTERDNFIYHEMLTHPALFTHRDPKRILIIGGGDCGSLREVLKHRQVEHADQVEIDERVTRAAERYFPELCDANDDVRAHFHFDDGLKWVARAPTQSYDVIIVDSTDPVGPAAGLFSPAFYRDCHKALTADGVLVAQSESPLYHLPLIKGMHAALRAAGFADAGTLPFPQCSYPSGWWSVTLACKRGAAGRFRETAAADKRFATRYYSRALHAGALAAPAFLAAALTAAAPAG